MIELQVINGCQKDGPCEQGSLRGEGFHVITDVNLKDRSVYQDNAFSPKLIDKETNLPFMESVMQNFPTMDLRCPFCNAPTKVNGVTNMNGITVSTETADEMREKAEESKAAMAEAEPWGEPVETDPGDKSMADSLVGDDLSGIVDEEITDASPNTEDDLEGDLEEELDGLLGEDEEPSDENIEDSLDGLLDEDLGDDDSLSFEEDPPDIDDIL